MKKRFFAAALSVAMVGTLLSGCSISTTSTPESDAAGTTAAAGETAAAETTTASQDLKGREEITLWFWGAEPYAQEAMQRILADKYNSSQDKYKLAIEFRPSVDTDMSTALASEKCTR